VRILLLGGPKFLGRAVADAALERGHELTFFNRGTTNPDLYPEVEKLRGDRDGGLEALRDGRWDVVVDTSGYLPRVVRASAELLAPACEHYVFVSSVSVYRDFSQPAHEESPLATTDDPGTEDVEEHYGALKALCEAEVAAAFAGRSLTVRAGLIVGPHDPTGRLTYWPHRVARGGEVLAPGPRERSVQFVDVRDLGAWIVVAAEARLTGPFNVAGEPMPLERLLAACRDVTGADARFTWVDESFLLEQEVGEWLELPLWLTGEGWERMLETPVTKAFDHGLRTRPLEETIGATLELAETVAGVGLDPAREEELLRTWHERVAA
jgi:2'-hydroxyisoflavone reductase